MALFARRTGKSSSVLMEGSSSGTSNKGFTSPLSLLIPTTAPSSPSLCDSSSPCSHSSAEAWSPLSSPTTPSSSSDRSPPLSPVSTRDIRSLQREAFASLQPSDLPFLSVVSHLLTLRSSSPTQCAAQAMSLIEDAAVPRCWRARAGVYRAESLWILGWQQEARRELGYAEKVLREGECGGDAWELMEALVGHSIAMGRLNWGDDAPSASQISVSLAALDLSTAQSP